MSTFPMTIMCVTAVSKAILFFLCYRVKTPTMSALAEDHRNDVASNIIALGCGLIGELLSYFAEHSYWCINNFIGSYAYQNTIDRRAIVVDPVGAILISVYIIISWVKQANRRLFSFNIALISKLSSPRPNQTTNWLYSKATISITNYGEYSIAFSFFLFYFVRFSGWLFIIPNIYSR